MWSASLGVGTAMMNASASGGSMLAVRRPMATAPLTATARSGSTNGASPRAIVFTVSGLMSTPTTCTPRVASAAAVGRPM